MSKKIVSLVTAAMVMAATAVPVFAASPSTATVVSTPVTVSTSVAAAKGYAVSAAEAQATATTPAQAVALASTAAVNTAGVATGAAAPAVVAMAKLDILKDASVQQAIIKNGGTGVIVASQLLANADGSTSTKRVSLTVAMTAPGEKVTILYYVPGDPTPKVLTATVGRNGTISARLPIPCVYNVVK